MTSGREKHDIISILRWANLLNNFSLISTVRPTFTTTISIKFKCIPWKFQHVTWLLQWQSQNTHRTMKVRKWKPRSIIDSRSQSAITEYNSLPRKWRFVQDRKCIHPCFPAGVNCRLCVLWKWQIQSQTEYGKICTYMYMLNQHCCGQTRFVLGCAHHDEYQWVFSLPCLEK